MPSANQSYFFLMKVDHPRLGITSSPVLKSIKFSPNNINYAINFQVLFYEAIYVETDLPDSDVELSYNFFQNLYIVISKDTSAEKGST